jgi:hypothetical protein
VDLDLPVHQEIAHEREAPSLDRDLGVGDGRSIEDDLVRHPGPPRAELGTDGNVPSRLTVQEVDLLLAREVRADDLVCIEEARVLVHADEVDLDRRDGGAERRLEAQGHGDGPAVWVRAGQRQPPGQDRRGGRQCECEQKQTEQRLLHRFLLVFSTR